MCRGVNTYIEKSVGKLYDNMTVDYTDGTFRRVRRHLRNLRQLQKAFGNFTACGIYFPVKTMITPQICRIGIGIQIVLQGENTNQLDRLKFGNRILPSRGSRMAGKHNRHPGLIPRYSLNCRQKTRRIRFQLLSGNIHFQIRLIRNHNILEGLHGYRNRYCHNTDSPHPRCRIPMWGGILHRHQHHNRQIA